MKYPVYLCGKKSKVLAQKPLRNTEVLHRVSLKNAAWISK